MSTLGLTQLISDRCRWLFNQEVHIVTFPRWFPNNAHVKMCAIVLPKTCHLSSVVESDINEKILFKFWLNGGTRENALAGLLNVIEEKINAILGGTPDRFEIQKSQLPDGYDYEPPRPEAIYEPSDFGTTLTPSVSAMSDGTATPTPKADFEDLAELNRRMIRGEIDLAVKEVLVPSMNDPNVAREPKVVLEGLAGLNRRVIREEIDRALREVLAPPDPSAPTSKVVEHEGLAGLHRRAIRKEVDLALRKVFGSL